MPITRLARACTALVLMMPLVAGCFDDRHGILASVNAGRDLEVPAITRTSAIAVLEDACGDTERDESLVERYPYLQSTGPRSSVLVWTSLAQAAEVVEVRTPEGELVGRFAGRARPTTFLEAGTQYEATIGGLEPSTVYCYSLSDDAGGALGPIGFRTAPLRGEDAPVRVLVFGDSGTGSDDQWALREQMDTVPIDLVLHTGDLAYLSGSMQQFEDYVFDVYEGLLSSVPFYPSIGNHDNRTANAGPYREAFVLPENGGEQQIERRYSFDWGPAHFVALDTERHGRDQAEWLERDLAASELPWKIVFAHESPFSSGVYGPSGSWAEHYVPVLRRQGVQLVFTGHDHHYERTAPMDGVTYVVTGGGGASTRHPSARDFTALAEGVIHFVLLEIDGNELRVHAIDGTGQEFDAFDIARQ
jgi:3',5'-cyclic AMP phosphodiesterase CpdA